MQYFGGKQRIARRLAEVIHSKLPSCSGYVEPFVGGASVLSLIRHDNRIASDSNLALITMFKALCSGWEPPSLVSEQCYKEIQANPDPNNPLTAFVASSCSFAGKWFGGYARDAKRRNFAAMSRRSLLVKLQGLHEVQWICCDYRHVDYPPKSLIYCDPPYSGTTGYAAIGKFDSQAFWQFCRDKQAEGHTVLVSEYIAPPDFQSVCDIETRTTVRTKANGSEPRIERLFTPCP